MACWQSRISKELHLRYVLVVLLSMQTWISTLVILHFSWFPFFHVYCLTWVLFFFLAGFTCALKSLFLQYSISYLLKVCGTPISDNVVNIIFHVFDTNRDGNLSSEEFLRVLHRRETDMAQPATTGLTGFLSCWFSCSKPRDLDQMAMQSWSIVLDLRQQSYIVLQLFEKPGDIEDWHARYIWRIVSSVIIEKFLEYLSFRIWSFGHAQVLAQWEPFGSWPWPFGR